MKVLIGGMECISITFWKSYQTIDEMERYEEKNIILHAREKKTKINNKRCFLEYYSTCGKLDRYILPLTNVTNCITLTCFVHLSARLAAAT